jgi:tetratricopeptide (TPR) repeat protein
VASGYACLERDDLDGADRAAAQARELLDGLDLEPHARLGAEVLSAQVLRARGRLAAALAALDHALDVTGGASLLFPRRQALAHRAGVLLQLGRVEDAVTAGREAVATPAEDVRAQVLGLRALGAALHAAGAGTEARQVLQQALDVARSTGQCSEVAASERALAERMPGSGGAVSGPVGPGARRPGS